MLAWLLTLSGSYFAGKAIGRIWLAALAGIFIGLVSGAVAGALVGVFGVDLFTPGQIVEHIIVSSLFYMSVGCIATAVVSWRSSRTQ